MRKIILLILGVITLAQSMSCSKKGIGKSNVQDTSGIVVTKPPASVADCKKCIILADQSQNRVAVADVNSKSIIWDWKPASPSVRSDCLSWFTETSDAKLVYNGKYILTTASGGGVALVRITDKKVMFYAYAGGNTHSAELLPDGNIVTASSTGNYLTIFNVDTLHFPDNVYSKIVPLDFAHNVVWDQKNQLLWSAAMNQIKSFRYNFNCLKPDLTLVDVIALPGTEAHELFPVYNEDALWLTNTTNVYKFITATKSLVLADVIQANIKSVSSGPADFPVIILRPKTSWWTDEVMDAKGNTIFFQSGLELYRARWLLNNQFSYPDNNPIHQCH